jgi:hypothetical protein
MTEITDDSITRERITRLRRLMLVHSAMYYRFMTSIVDDQQFDLWSYELRDLQNANPAIAATCLWADEFDGWDGTTGMTLPNYMPWLLHAVQRLLDYERDGGADVAV